ncbi:armadillo repeat-containing protein 1 [Lates japonicus]|uniref:Armadillo repeat-containing protein 1 n=1 Tax=Lates japonicus TaxID=270547 RepID=A0AAD3MHS0_LATJO|nr:armadillo repeat-containing protein 1 [Lates japonicus]
MSAEVDALTVVNQLRDLAADPLNRRAIVEDQGCLPGLILFLDHPNPQVVYSALLAVRYLAECRANREKMKGELGMMLRYIAWETKLLALEIWRDPRPSGKEEAEQARRPPPTGGEAQFFLGSNNKRAKTGKVLVENTDIPDYYPRRIHPEQDKAISTHGAPLPQTAWAGSATAANL